MIVQEFETIAYFSDYFGVTPNTVEEFGAFNISLINDLPLFIDPFLLFNSQNPEYLALHDRIIDYLRFLRTKSATGSLDKAGISAWYTFSEVKQNWLGFSMSGNSGRGLGKDFAHALYGSLHKIFSDFGTETVTKGSHLEKLCLFKTGVGRDNISDFTTNLIKEYLLTYTESFAKEHIHPELLARFRVNKVRFNYETETWEPRYFVLPQLDNDFVLLTPRDMLTQDENWINRPDLYDDFRDIPYSIPDDELRFQINNYFEKVLPIDHEKKDWNEAVEKTIAEFPEILDYYIRLKEETGDQAADLSAEKVKLSYEFYVNNFSSIISSLASLTKFYKLRGRSYDEAMKRVMFLKDVIENKDGYRYLYKDGQPVHRETDLHILYRLTWFATEYDVNREVNNGRGPVDFKISKGRKDATLVEFKLARNSKLRKNLENQVEIYQKASDTDRAITVIFCFTYGEQEKVRELLDELGLQDNKNIVLINARDDDKPSGSVA